MRLRPCRPSCSWPTGCREYRPDILHSAASWYPLGPSTSITSQLNSYVVGQAVQRACIRENGLLHGGGTHHGARLFLRLEQPLHFADPRLILHVVRPRFPGVSAQTLRQGSHSLRGRWFGRRLRALYKRASWVRPKTRRLQWEAAAAQMANVGGYGGELEWTSCGWSW
ncbi:hypothetical protein NL676_007268 [Syzygium grande]|nr:hypothetical protein NL676_007268 [Syzygium grande]